MKVVYRYKIRTTRANSHKYGLCEVCKKHVSEVFIQTEELKYEEGWTRDKCRTLFGHKECLIKMRRNS